MAVTTPRLGAYITRFNGRMGAFKRGVLLKLFSAVIKDTPVLTGRLRANWTFSAGGLPQAFNTGFEDPTAGVVQGVNATVTVKDDHYYLANSMPYCNRIEYLGWSHTKSPEGMVRRNITRIASLLSTGRNK